MYEQIKTILVVYDIFLYKCKMYISQDQLQLDESTETDDKIASPETKEAEDAQSTDKSEKHDEKDIQYLETKQGGETRGRKYPQFAQHLPRQRLDAERTYIPLLEVNNIIRYELNRQQQEKPDHELGMRWNQFPRVKFPTTGTKSATMIQSILDHRTYVMQPKLASDMLQPPQDLDATLRSSNDCIILLGPIDFLRYFKFAFQFQGTLIAIEMDVQTTMKPDGDQSVLHYIKAAQFIARKTKRPGAKAHFVLYPWYCTMRPQESTVPKCSRTVEIIFSNLTYVISLIRDLTHTLDEYTSLIWVSPMEMNKLESGQMKGMTQQFGNILDEMIEDEYKANKHRIRFLNGPAIPNQIVADYVSASTTIKQPKPEDYAQETLYRESGGSKTALPTLPHKARIAHHVLAFTLSTEPQVWSSDLFMLPPQLEIQPIIDHLPKGVPDDNLTDPDTWNRMEERSKKRPIDTSTPPNRPAPGPSATPSVHQPKKRRTPSTGPGAHDNNARNRHVKNHWHGKLDHTPGKWTRNKKPAAARNQGNSTFHQPKPKPGRHHFSPHGNRGGHGRPPFQKY